MKHNKTHQKVILNSIQDLQRSPLLFITSMRGRFQIKFGMTSLFKNNGFTLIELLVVVLIIGILAAVAVPQYKKAVTRAHYAELQALVKSIYQAEQVYHLANGTYTVEFADLDIDVAGSTTPTNEPYRQKFKNSFCMLDSSYLYCKNNDIKMGYRMDYTGERACAAYNANDAVAHSICRAETGRSGPSEGYSSTYFYP